jgi:hypothetical protein
MACPEHNQNPTVEIVGDKIHYTNLCCENFKAGLLELNKAEAEKFLKKEILDAFKG